MMRVLQKTGKSLMIPIVVMPAAAILLRIGLIDFDSDFMQRVASVFYAGGHAIFAHLPLLFAVGIAIGLSGGQGIAALSAVVGYLVFSHVVSTFDPAAGTDMIEKLDTGVLGGILVGMVTAFLYTRCKDIELPQALGFFSGKRFVPMITSIVSVFLGVLIGVIWSPVQVAIREFGMWIVSLGGMGSFVYGFLNRMLIPTGLHHIINNIAWLQIGEFIDESGKLVQGDLARFFAQDPSAGMFMTGFFPIMMFGLPAAALAFIKTAQPDKKNMVTSVMITAGLTSFLTGITEPLEFAFMFNAPLLYVVHAVLTGTSMLFVHLLEIKMGFGFSAGFIDLLLNWNLATHPWRLVLVGFVYFFVYYFVFITLIRLFQLHTPGREHDSATSHSQRTPPSSHIEEKAAVILSLVGGDQNVKEVDACITRLRLTLVDDSKINEFELTKLGAYGIIRLGQGHVHLVFGTDSELLRDAMLQKKEGVS